MELRRLLYFNNIGFAHSAMANNDMDRAYTLLDGCDPRTCASGSGTTSSGCATSAARRPTCTSSRPRYASFTRDRSRVALATLDREVVLLDLGQQPRAAPRTTARRRRARGRQPRRAVARVRRGRRRGRPRRTRDRRAARAEGRARHSRDAPASKDLRAFVAFTAGLANRSSPAALDQRPSRVGRAIRLALRTTIPLGEPRCRSAAPSARRRLGGRRRQQGRRCGCSTSHGQALSHASPATMRRSGRSRSPRDGTRLASGDNDARAIVWDPAIRPTASRQRRHERRLDHRAVLQPRRLAAGHRAAPTPRPAARPARRMSTAGRAPRAPRTRSCTSTGRTTTRCTRSASTARLKTWDADSALQVPTIVTGQPREHRPGVRPHGEGRLSSAAATAPCGAGSCPPSSTRRATRGPALRATTRATCWRSPSTARAAASARPGGTASSASAGSIATNPPLVISPGTGPISAVDFSPDGDRADRRHATASCRCGTRTRAASFATTPTRKSSRTRCASTARRTLFYGACADGHLRRWSVDSPQPIAEAMVDPHGVVRRAAEPRRQDTSPSPATRRASRCRRGHARNDPPLRRPPGRRARPSRSTRAAAGSPPPAATAASASGTSPPPPS